MMGDRLRADGKEQDYVDKLIEALRHPEPTTPVRAAWVLGEKRDRRAVAVLMRIVTESEDPELLATAAASLGKLGDLAAIPVLVRLASTSFLKVRLAAVHALGQWDTSEARAAVRKALGDPNAVVRREAEHVLRGMPR